MKTVNELKEEIERLEQLYIERFVSVATLIELQIIRSDINTLKLRIQLIERGVLTTDAKRLKTPQ